MTEEQFELLCSAVELYRATATRPDRGDDAWYTFYFRDVPTLIAEVRRLRAELTWIVENGTDHQSNNRARAALGKE